MKYLDKKEGSVFFIPLFLPKNIKDNNKSYYRYKFDKEELYAFGRLIDDGEGSGDLIEIFNYTGIIPDDVNVIIDSGLMFKPLHIAQGFKKKRYRFIFEDNNYDKNIDSNYQDIGFVLGGYLWKGGKKDRDLTESEMDEYLKYYNSMRIYAPTQLEEKIIEKCCPAYKDQYQ